MKHMQSTEGSRLRIQWYQIVISLWDFSTGAVANDSSMAADVGTELLTNCWSHHLGGGSNFLVEKLTERPIYSILKLSRYSAVSPPESRFSVCHRRGLND